MKNTDYPKITDYQKEVLEILQMALRHAKDKDDYTKCTWSCADFPENTGLNVSITSKYIHLSLIELKAK